MQSQQLGQKCFALIVDYFQLWLFLRYACNPLQCFSYFRLMLCKYWISNLLDELKMHSLGFFAISN